MVVVIDEDDCPRSSIIEVAINNTGNGVNGSTKGGVLRTCLIRRAEDRLSRIGQNVGHSDPVIIVVVAVFDLVFVNSIRF